MKTSVLILTVSGFCALASVPLCADDAAVPGEGFNAAHYETLWTKSPFSVATPDAVEESPDYALVGIAQFDGIAYASVVDNHTQDHFLISTEKEVKGLKLVSINKSRTGSDTYASVQKSGQPLTLKLQAQAAGAGGGAPGIPLGLNMPGNAPGEAVPMSAPSTVQNIPMPGVGTPPPGAYNSGNALPRSIRVHRPTIHLPPAPGQQPAGNVPPPPSAAPQGAQPVQPHNVPPPQ